MPVPSNTMTEAPRGKILVTEDNPAVRDFVVRALTASHYKVVAVGDGQKAFEALAKEKFDVLVTDIVMPNVDGIELARKATQKYPELRIVMISGYAQERMRVNNVPELPHKVIAKPFSLEEICTAVRDAMEKPPIKV